MIKNRLLLGAGILAILTSCGGSRHYDPEHYIVKMAYKDNFKIMQLTDMHFGTSTNVDRQFKFLSKNITDASPDLIIITGDSFMISNKAIVNSVLKFIDSFNIKFAFTYGNHDNQGEYDSNYIADELMKCKNIVNPDERNDDITGYNNFAIDLVDDDKNDIKYRLMVIDSNSYHYIGPKYAYDIIHEDQLNHFKKLYEFSKDKEYEALAFYHIPIYEYKFAHEAYKTDKSIGRGANQEPPSVGYKSTNAFDVFKGINVKGMIIGHDHINDTDILYKDVMLSYGIKSTDEIYHDKEMVGYKLITLNDDKPYGFDNLTNNFRKY
ncbi:MAG: metallophosphoesterase [Bacilli bacterium]